MNKFCTNCKHHPVSDCCSDCYAMNKWEARFPTSANVSLKAMEIESGIHKEQEIKFDEMPNKVYITTARGGGKNFYNEAWRRFVETNIKPMLNTDNVKGENDMEEFVRNLAKSDITFLDLDGRRYPVEIDTINQEFGGPVKFIGHLARLDYDSYYPRTDLCAATPASTILKEIIDRRINQIKNRTLLPEIKRVHFSGPVTAVIWADGTKTLVRCTNEDIDYEKGLAMAIAKKAFGTNESGSNYYDLFKKFLPKEE